MSPAVGQRGNREYPELGRNRTDFWSSFGMTERRMRLIGIPTADRKTYGRRER